MKMKKLVLASAMAIFSFGLGISQIKVAATLGTYSSTTDFNGSSSLPMVDPMRSLTGGIQLETAMDENLSFVSGVHYKRRGFSTTVGTEFSIGDVPIPVGVKAINTINYVEVPILLKYSTPNFGNIKAYVFAGPALNHASSARIQTRATAIIDFNISNTELNLESEDFNRLGIFANLGAGLEVPYKSGFVLAEVGYDKSLTQFTNSNSLIDLGVKHNGWGVRLGYGMAF